MQRSWDESLQKKTVEMIFKTAYQHHALVHLEEQPAIDAAQLVARIGVDSLYRGMIGSRRDGRRGEGWGLDIGGGRGSCRPGGLDRC